MKISFHTFGCKSNLYDSNKIASSLSNNASFEIIEGVLCADVHVVNTCTITSSSDAQARNLIRKIDKNNKGALVLIIGCSVRSNMELYTSMFSELNNNRFLAMDNLKEDIISCLEKELSEKILDTKITFPVFRTRAFIKITDGCNNFCSYCIVPFVRGRERSKPITEIVEEVNAMIVKDVKELVITGISIGDYSFGLESLLKELLISTKNVRFRISSLRPSKISDQLIELMDDKRICPHLHLSLQSASNRVLNLMNRHDYTSEYFFERITSFYNKLRHRNPFIAADIITGFPGEGDKDFLDTMEILNNVPINKLHVFEFSPRPGTKAFEFKRENGSEVRKRRNTLLEFSEKRHIRSLNDMIGKFVEILWEKENIGHTENYHQVEGTGYPNTLETAKIKSVNLNKQILQL